MIWNRKTRRLEQRVKELEAEKLRMHDRLVRISRAIHTTQRAYTKDYHMTGDILWAVATDVELLVQELEGEK